MHFCPPRSSLVEICLALVIASVNVGPVLQKMFHQYCIEASGGDDQRSTPVGLVNIYVCSMSEEKEGNVNLIFGDCRERNGVFPLAALALIRA